MPLTAPTTVQPLKVVANDTLVRSMLDALRTAHTEVSLADLLDVDSPVTESERRQQRRSQLQVPVVLTPAEWTSDDEDGVRACGPEQVGITRDISPTGIGVTHDHLLGTDIAILQFDLPGEGPVSFLLDLRWSVRKTRYSYMSGGRIVGLIESAVA